MPILSRRTHVVSILVLAAAALTFQLLFKDRIEDDDIQNLKRSFMWGRHYIGQYAPDFELTTLEGEAFRLSDHLGTNVVVLNFFTTWCGPCRSEMPELSYFVKEMEDDPVVFLAIDVKESPGQVAALLEDLEVTLPAAVDAEGTVAEKYRIGSYPTTVVISPHGRIVLYEAGAIANADVSLAPVVRMHFSALEHMPQGYGLDDYRENAPEILVDHRHVETDIVVEMPEEVESEGAEEEASP